MGVWSFFDFKPGFISRGQNHDESTGLGLSNFRVRVFTIYSINPLIPSLSSTQVIQVSFFHQSIYL